MRFLCVCCAGIPLAGHDPFATTGARGAICLTDSPFWSATERCRKEHRGPPGPGWGACVNLLFVVAVGWLTVYSFSVALHPYRRCPDCMRTQGRHWGSVFRSSFRACHRCNGRGRIQRAGAWILRYGEKDQNTRRVRGMGEY